MAKATKTTNAETSLTSTGDLTRKDVPKLIETLKEKLKSLVGDEDKEEKLPTSMKFKGYEVLTIDKITKLVDILAVIRFQDKNYHEELERIFPDKSTRDKIQKYTIDGHPLSLWEKAINNRLKFLINEKEVKMIKSSIQELEKHLDAETKLQMTLKNIMSSSESLIE